MAKIICTDRVRNELSHAVKMEKNRVRTVKWRKAD
jgi:hypothetical protein